LAKRLKLEWLFRLPASRFVCGGVIFITTLALSSSQLQIYSDFFGKKYHAQTIFSKLRFIFNDA